MTQRMFESIEDEYLAEAHNALLVLDIIVARCCLANANSAFAQEIDGLVRAGMFADALHRLRVYLNPKYPSLEECEQHVGEPFHFLNS